MQVTLKGTPVNTIGNLPSIGSIALPFTLVKTDFTTITSKELAGKNIILNIFISVDTPVCARSVREFNEAASRLKNTVILCVSQDLPFAQQRFCGAENLNAVIPVSTFRNPEFGMAYGVTLVDGPLENLLARSIVLIDPNQKVIYTELVPEISQDPNYGAVLKLLN